MLIVAGKLKGRKLEVPARLKVTEARIKKALYDILAPEFLQRCVLDLFAGSGALGIEALSWGAEKAIFVDRSSSHIRLIRRNLDSLGLAAAEVYCADAFSFIRKMAQQKRKADIVLLDPPYRQSLTTKCLKEIYKYDILASSGLAVSLSFSQERLEGGGYFCLFQRRYGDRIIRIFQRSKNDNSLSRHI